MTAAAEAGPAAGPHQAFTARTVIALVVVGLVAFAAFAVLIAYAPDLRSGQDGRAHALSKSAVGYAGAPIFLRAMGVPAVVSRSRPTQVPRGLVILTPEVGQDAKALRAYPKGPLTLIVLPKWWAANDPLRQGFVRKVALVDDHRSVGDLLGSYGAGAQTAHRAGVSRPVLRGAGPLADIGPLTLGPVDRLKTISGAGWIPLLTDEQGRAVLVASARSHSIWVLADADLLNNQGLASPDTARAAWRILDAGRRGGPVVFDVTLNGFQRGRGLWRTMLEPPWLAATLCALAAAILMGLHALARFGQPRRTGRAFALGARALVDNAADLLRAARREPEVAPAYAALVCEQVSRAAGAHADQPWLAELARRRGAAAPSALAAEAEAVNTRDELLAVARKLYEWRGEMTRERR